MCANGVLETTGPVCLCRRAAMWFRRLARTAPSLLQALARHCVGVALVRYTCDTIAFDSRRSTPTPSLCVACTVRTLVALLSCTFYTIASSYHHPISQPLWLCLTQYDECWSEQGSTKKNFYELNIFRKLRVVWEQAVQRHWLFSFSLWIFSKTFSLSFSLVFVMPTCMIYKATKLDRQSLLLLWLYLNTKKMKRLICNNDLKNCLYFLNIVDKQLKKMKNQQSIKMYFFKKNENQFFFLKKKSDIKSRSWRFGKIKFFIISKFTTFIRIIKIM